MSGWRHPMNPDLERLNSFYDEVCGKPLVGGVTAEQQLQPPPPPSLEAIESWLKRHRDRAESLENMNRLDLAVEAVEDTRRSEC